LGIRLPLVQWLFEIQKRQLVFRIRLAGSSLALFVLFSEKITEAIELSFPRGAVIANPLLEKPKSGGLDSAGSYAAQLFRLHEPYLFEDLQMLGNGRERDAKGLSESRNGHGAVREPVEDRATRGIPQCVKEAIDLWIRGGHRWFDSRRAS
jgi:hypothetical protein